jgi:hypothetical protein
MQRAAVGALGCTQHNNHNFHWHNKSAMIESQACMALHHQWMTHSGGDECHALQNRRAQALQRRLRRFAGDARPPEGMRPTHPPPFMCSLGQLGVRLRKANKALGASPWGKCVRPPALEAHGEAPLGRLVWATRAGCGGLVAVAASYHRCWACRRQSFRDSSWSCHWHPRCAWSAGRCAWATPGHRPSARLPAGTRQTRCRRS